MSDITTRYTKGSQLSITEGDTQIGDINLTYSSATLTLDETHNREHIILQSGCTAIEFTATATLSAALDMIDASNAIGWYCKISNNSGAEVTINSGGVQFNGGTGTFYLPDNASIELSFDNVSSTKGYWMISSTSPSTDEVYVSPTSIGTGSTKDISFTGTVNRIEIGFNDISLAGSAFVLLRLGTGGAATSSGYYSQSTDITSGTITQGESTTDMLITALAMVASQGIHGHIHLTHTGSNKWVMSGVASHASSNIVMYNANITLAGALDLVQFRTGSTFDGGNFSVTYWRS